MTLQQKIAWLNLSVAVVALVGYATLIPILGPWRAMGAFGILGLAGFSGVLYFLERRKGHIIGDERDTTINRKAFIIAKSALWVILIAAFMITLYSVGDHGTVTMQGVSLAILLAFCGYLLIYAVATLILYARD
jgi:hypothetical protein